MKERKAMKDRSKSKLTDKLIDFLKFYNKNLKKKHIICFIVSLLVFAYIITSLINNTTTDITEMINNNLKNTRDVNLFVNIFNNKIVLIFLLILSGITPFIYIPLLGLLYPVSLAINIVSMNGFSVLWATMGAIIQIFASSLAVATGIYYCKLATSKFRYSQTTSFGLNDIKKQIYETRKQDEKLEKLNIKMQEKYDKKQKLNVNIPYRYIIMSGCISIIIIVLAAVITGV